MPRCMITATLPSVFQMVYLPLRLMLRMTLPFSISSIFFVIGARKFQLFTITLLICLFLILSSKKLEITSTSGSSGMIPPSKLKFLMVILSFSNTFEYSAVLSPKNSSPQTNFERGLLCLLCCCFFLFKIFCFKAFANLFFSSSFSLFLFVLFIIIIYKPAVVAQVVEYLIGNDEVPSSNLGNGTLIILIILHNL